VVAVSSALLLRVATGYLWDEAEADAVRLAEHATSATRYAMLRNEPQHVGRILESFAKGVGVRYLRLYDAAGVSKVPVDRKRRPLDLSSSSCTSCHVDPRGAELPAGRCAHWSDGTMVLYYPIHNEPECGRPTCHPAPARAHLLGILEVGIDGAQIAQRVQALRVRGVVWGIVVLAASGLPLLFGLGWAVERPMAECVRLVREISRDNLSVRSRLRRTDEWGELLASFNAMVSALRSARSELETLNRDLEDQVRRRTRELEQALEAAQESDQMKTEFLANLSHEFSTPLQGVIGYAQLLLDGIDGEVTVVQRRDLEAILRNGRRLLDWAEDLLELARLDAKRRFLCVDRIRVQDLLEEVVEALGDPAARGSVAISQRVERDCPEVLGDVGALRRTLFHVVDNAVRHSGGGQVSVEAACESDIWVEIVVRDTGPGMDAEVLQAALRGFTSKGGGGGLAVGLAMARRLVEIHGGTFEVASAPGEGTSVTLRLPAAPPETDA
jgi:signal transduction histidine kinase